MIKGLNSYDIAIVSGACQCFCIHAMQFGEPACSVPMDPSYTPCSGCPAGYTTGLSYPVVSNIWLGCASSDIDCHAMCISNGNTFIAMRAGYTGSDGSLKNNLLCSNSTIARCV